MPDMPGMSKQNRRLSTSWRPTIWGCWRDASAEARLRRQAKKRGGNTIPNAQRTWHKSHGSKSFHYQQASVHRRTPRGRSMEGDARSCQHHESNKSQTKSIQKSPAVAIQTHSRSPASHGDSRSLQCPKQNANIFLSSLGGCTFHANDHQRPRPLVVVQKKRPAWEGLGWDSWKG